MHRSLFGTSGATIKIMEFPEFDRILGKYWQVALQIRKEFCSSKRYPQKTYMYISVNKDKEIKRIYKQVIQGVLNITIQAAYPYVE